MYRKEIEVVRDIVRDETRQKPPQYATVWRVDGERCDVRLVQSKALIRGLECSSALVVGATVLVRWEGQRPSLATGLSASSSSSASAAVSASSSTGVTDHGQLTGLGDDDHPHYLHTGITRTITALHAFAPTSVRAPFTLGANAQGERVVGFNADLIDGVHASTVPGAFLAATSLVTGKLAAGWIQEVLALADMTDVTAKTGTGTTVVMSTSPTIATPTLTVPVIASFASAQHAHTNAASGGTIVHASLTSRDADDHVNYVHLANARVITAQHSFSPGVVRAPFVLGANAHDQLVSYLNSDLVDDEHASAFASTDGSGTRIGYMSERLNKSLLAGAGLTGGGLWTDNRTLALATPGSLSATSVNAAGAPHTHAITASSNPGAATQVLKSTVTGGLTLESFTSNGEIVAAQSIYGGGNSFRVLHHTHDYDHVHVVINPRSGFTTVDEQFGVIIDDNLLVMGYIVGKHALQLKGARFLGHYDGPEPYQRNFTGQDKGHMGQVPSSAAGLIYRPGLFGKAVQSAQATTNLIANPSIETNTTGWAALMSATLTRVSTDSYIGEYSLKIDTPGATTGGASVGASTSTHGTYTGQLRHKAASSGSVGRSMTLYVRATYTDSTTDETTVTVPLEEDWAFCSASHATNTGKTLSAVNILFRDAASGAALSCFVDAVQLEAKAYATPYCDGSLGLNAQQAASASTSGTVWNGHSWSGTEHASSSSRTAAGLTYSAADFPILPLKGTVMAWVYVRALTGAIQYVFRSSNTASTAHRMLYISATGYLSGSWGSAVIADTTVFPVGQWVHVAITSNGTTANLFRNGAQVASGSTGTPLDGTMTMATARVGHRNSAEHLNGFLDELVYLTGYYPPTADADATVKDDVIRAVYQSEAPVFAETSSWHWRSANNLVWADSEGLWMVDASGYKVLAAYGLSAAKSWGGRTLNQGDFMIGDASHGSAHYMHWINSTGVIEISGNITVLGGNAATTTAMNAGDSATLTSANSTSASGDATTLASANTNAAAGDATTLSGANTNAAAGDASTLSAAQVYADASSATAQTAAQNYGALRKLLGCSAVWTSVSGTGISWDAHALRFGDGTSKAVGLGSATLAAGQSYIYADASAAAPLTLAITQSFSTLGINHVLVAVANTGADKASIRSAIGATLITGEGIATGSIVANNIKSNTITASQIAARTITTETMIIGSRMNLIDNYSVSGGTVSVAPPGWSVAAGSPTTNGVATSQTKDSYAVVTHQVTANDNTMLQSNYIEVDPTASYEINLSVLCNFTTGSRFFGMYAYDTTQTLITSLPFTVSSRALGAASNNIYFWSGAGYPGGSSGVWRDMTAYIVGCNTTVDEIPEGKNVTTHVKLLPNTRYIRIRYLNWANAGISSTAHFYSPSVAQVGATTINGNLIVTGTLNANRIVANSITAAQILAGTITTTQLNATAIDGMTITGSTIRTSSGTTRIEMTNAKIAGIAGGVDQWYANTTDGKLYAGAGSVQIDATGLQMTAQNGAYSTNGALKWQGYATRDQFQVYGTSAGSGGLQSHLRANAATAAAGGGGFAINNLVAAVLNNSTGANFRSATVVLTANDHPTTPFTKIAATADTFEMTGAASFSGLITATGGIDIPVQSTVPSGGEDGEIRGYINGATYRIYLKLSGTWRQVALA